MRGTGNSGGCLEQTAENQIGMYGVSYDAETQVSVAGLGDPALIAPASG